MTRLSEVEKSLIEHALTDADSDVFLSADYSVEWVGPTSYVETGEFDADFIGEGVKLPFRRTVRLGAPVFPKKDAA